MRLTSASDASARRLADSSSSRFFFAAAASLASRFAAFFARSSRHSLSSLCIPHTPPARIAPATTSTHAIAAIAVAARPVARTPDPPPPPPPFAAFDRAPLRLPLSAASARRRTTSGCPNWAARSAAVFPRTTPPNPPGVLARGSAPASKSCDTTSARPSAAAHCSGVNPSPSATASRSAPAAASARAHRQSDVAWMGARPRTVSRAFGLDPAPRIASVAHPSPRSAASCSGVRPSRRRALGSAPARGGLRWRGVRWRGGAARRRPRPRR